MTVPVIQDVVNGIAPIENELLGVHPRLHFTPQAIEELRGKIGTQPWSRYFARIRTLADGGKMPDLALVYLLTGESKYLDGAREALLGLVNNPAWPKNPPHDGFVWSDLMYNLALGYDWLYHDLEPAFRQQVRDFLYEQARKHYEPMATHGFYHVNVYAHNHMTNLGLNVLSAACALFGEVEGIGPWLRYFMEKVRTITEALAADGASPEGICYGAFFTEYYMKMLDLTRTLLGWDFFTDNAYLRHVPNYFLYCMLPERRLTEGNVHLCFGDGVRYNWHGPEYFLRKLAAEYRNPYAEWAADLQEEKHASRDIGAFLNLAWDDPAVTPKPPADLPTLHHFTDKGLVIMRSGWDGDESVFGFRCGPHAGRHALKNYPQSIGGGHMAPDAGSFLLYAHGDWLISDGWYAKKFTNYRNTVLVNGIGQTGEGGEWFECLELRREKRGPSIPRVEREADYDYIIGNVAPAYEHAAKLIRYLRHVLYLRPDCWVLIDELETVEPSTFDLYFHAYGQPFQTDRPFTPAGERVWTTGGENGSLRITALQPDNVQGFPEIQQMLGIGAHRDREMCILRLRNGEPATRALFVTVLEAYPTAGKAKIQPRFEQNELILGTDRFSLSPWQADPAMPAIERI